MPAGAPYASDTVCTTPHADTNVGFCLPSYWGTSVNYVGARTISGGANIVDSGSDSSNSGVPDIASTQELLATTMEVATMELPMEVGAVGMAQVDLGRLHCLLRPTPGQHQQQSKRMQLVYAAAGYA